MRRRALIAWLAMSLAACSGRPEFRPQQFVGKWQSSRATTPIRLDANGEWELVAADGKVLQYGVWQYFNGKIMWSVIVDQEAQHDVTTVLSASDKEFRLGERDQSVTTFKRLD